ncbi:MAG: 2-C-methyl-D-erythritol 4-phosphate cytidylyltransferase [Lachnospiraceae bacterium]|nr:2-C-methyl-D-erythritol 4-phosphate cytidylyltransferase [Lachnospiraceae bacterium]MBQ8549068.1 2-C-methyl-D-erythritol 4-phosphate cytidylyltransferase [Lachnospiraceae bacterium]
MAAAGIVLAGGKGSRMQSDVPKQYMELLGKPLLYYSLKAFEDSDAEQVVLVTAEGDEEYCRKELVERFGFAKVVAIVAGGAERYASVWNGLKCLKEQEPDYVLIHDGARPLVTAELINRLITETEQYNACVAGMPVKDTIQMTDERGTITLTPKRDSLWTAQTPQSFEFSLAYDAYEQLMREQEINVTDDAMVVGLYHDIPIQMVRGSYTNIKVTTPEDLVLAEAFLKKRI